MRHVYLGFRALRPDRFDIYIYRIIIGIAGVDLNLTYAKEEVEMTRKLILGIVVLALAMSASLSCTEPKAELEGQNIPFITGMEIRDPVIASKYGIRGYLEILPAGSSEELYISRGGEANTTILLHFVSYTPELTEIEVSIDTEDTPSIRVCYGVLDAQGNMIGDGVIHVNRLVSYSPSGRVFVKAGETLPVTMTIRVPADLPERISESSIPLGAVGIRTDVPLISEIGRLKVMLDG